MPDDLSPHTPSSADNARLTAVDRAAVELAWQLCLALAVQRRRQSEPDEGEYRLQTRAGQAPELLLTDPGDPNAVARWLRTTGWQVAPAWPAAAVALLDLYWPILSAPQGLVIAQQCQSLDGWIATREGDASALLTGPLRRHRQRLRGLVDAVIVGATMASTDDASLRELGGPGDGYPVRVILDPTARLSPSLRLFNDERVPALLVCGSDHQRMAESRWGKGRVIGVPVLKRRLDLKAMLARLRDYRLRVLLVEGGGTTVAHFHEARCLDRLHLAQVGVLMGGGREGLHVPPPIGAPRAVIRPERRVYRFGDDLMWDCDLRASREPAADDRPDDAVIAGDFARLS